MSNRRRPSHPAVKMGTQLLEKLDRERLSDKMLHWQVKGSMGTNTMCPRCLLGMKGLRFVFFFKCFMLILRMFVWMIKVLQQNKTENTANHTITSRAIFYKYHYHILSQINTEFKQVNHNALVYKCAKESKDELAWLTAQSQGPVKEN